jgi:hypothetical protein
LSDAALPGVAGLLRRGGLLYSESPAGLLRKGGCFTPKNAAKGAIIALNEGRNVDAAGMLITAALKENQITLTPELVSNVISGLPSPIEPFPHFGIDKVKKNHGGTEEAFNYFITRDSKLIEETVINLLGSDQSNLVATTCTAVQLLMESLPDFSVKQYFQPLLKALSQEREDEDAYVDASICQTYAKMMIREPQAISKEIFSAIDKAGEELQETLFRVFIRDEALEAAEVWIEPFINLLTNTKLSDQTKFEMSELLSYISRDRPEIVFAHITGLLGVLAIVSDLEDSKRKLAREPSKEKISFLEYQSSISALSGAARNLREVIENVETIDTERTLSEIRDLIQNTSTYLSKTSLKS